MKKPMCQRCHEKAAVRPRGLCWTCYYTPGVRDQFSSGSKYAKRGLGEIRTAAPPQYIPLPMLLSRQEARRIGGARTGLASEERLEILSQRAAAMVPLFGSRRAAGDEAGSQGTTPRQGSALGRG